MWSAGLERPNSSAEVPDAKVRMMSRHVAELLGGTRASMVLNTIATDYVSIFCHAGGETPARVGETRAIRHGEITGDAEWIVKRPGGGA